MKQNILIEKQEKIGLKHHRNSKFYIEYSNNMKDVYEILKIAC